NTQAVVNGGIWAAIPDMRRGTIAAPRRIQTGGGADFGRVNARVGGGGFWRISWPADELQPIRETAVVTTLGDKMRVVQRLRHDDMRQSVEYRHIGAGPQLQMMVGTHVRRPHKVDAARVNDDQTSALPKAALHARSENWVCVCGIGANDHHHIGFFYGLESLRPCVCSISLPQPIACRRMAEPRAGVDIVIAKGGTHHLLHEIGFFVGAARRGNTAHRTDSMPGLNSADLRSRVVDRLFPAHHLPRVVDGLTYHRSGDAVLVGGVSPGKAPLHTEMPLIGLAVLPRHHAHNLVAL